MDRGYQGKYAPLLEKQGANEKKRKKHNTSDTSSPRTPPTGISGFEFPQTSKSQFKTLDMNDKLNCLFDIMTNLAPLHMKIDQINQSLYHSKAIHDVTEARLRLLEYKSIDNETRALRSNLIFNGHAESNDSEDCVAVLKSFLQKQLELDPNHICIVSAYRLGRRQAFRSGKKANPRPILATFSHTGHVDDIMSRVTMLRNTDFGVSRDYPREVREARKELWPDFKEARSRFGAKNVKLVFPAALVINGDTVRNMFPGWYEVLRGSRNTNSKARVEARYQHLVKEYTQAVAEPITIRNETAGSDPDPDPDPDSDPDSDDREDITDPQHIDGERVLQGSNPTLTRPGYLLSAHPLMTGSQVIETNNEGALQVPPLVPPQESPPAPPAEDPPGNNSAK